MIRRAVTLLILAGVAGVVVKAIPDITGYLRIRRM
jgi:hypothetical protein